MMGGHSSALFCRARSVDVYVFVFVFVCVCVCVCVVCVCVCVCGNTTLVSLSDSMLSKSEHRGASRRARTDERRSTT